jgi:hypothetical protein
MRFFRRHVLGPIVRKYMAHLQEHRDNIENMRRSQIPRTIAYLDRKIAGWRNVLYRLNK